MNEATPPRRPVYRLYIDEVGHASLKTGTTDAERYLCLVGVACHLDHIKTTVQPQMQHLKRFFAREPQTLWQDPDERMTAKPVVFHRKEMVSYLHPFEALREPQIRVSFDAELLNCLTEWQYTVFSVVIDKDRLQTKYLLSDTSLSFRAGDTLRTLCSLSGAGGIGGGRDGGGPRRE